MITSIERIINDEYSYTDKKISVIGRVYTIRKISDTLAFLIIRDINRYLFQSRIGETMIDYIDNLTLETIVKIEGSLKLAPSPINQCDVHHHELAVEHIEIVSASNLNMQIQIKELNMQYMQPSPDTFFKKTKKQTIENDISTRLNNRNLSLRSDRNFAIFNIKSIVNNTARKFLLERGFIEIQTPKIIGVASESGAQVFELKYFDKTAYLAQSPQLYKQMLINSDFGRVFEVGPVFRAEKSHTSRHLCEFTGFDLEMRITDNYHEVLEILYGILVAILDKLHASYLDLYHTASSAPFPQYHKKPFILNFNQAVKLLRKNNIQIGNYDDLSTENEKLLGDLVKREFGVDLFILDKYPSNLRPFYTMKDPKNEKYSNSYDIIFRGVEILSGAQREHSHAKLLQNVNQTIGEEGAKSVDFYLNSFEHGSYPHGGGGFGLERIVKCILDLSNIREACLFPRDPERIIP